MRAPRALPGGRLDAQGGAAWNQLSAAPRVWWRRDVNSPQMRDASDSAAKHHDAQDDRHQPDPALRHGRSDDAKRDLALGTRFLSAQMLNAHRSDGRLASSGHLIADADAP